MIDLRQGDVLNLDVADESVVAVLTDLVPGPTYWREISRVMKGRKPIPMFEIQKEGM